MDVPLFINEEVEKERERQIGYSMRERRGGGGLKETERKRWAMGRNRDRLTDREF